MKKGKHKQTAMEKLEAMVCAQDKAFKSVAAYKAKVAWNPIYQDDPIIDDPDLDLIQMCDAIHERKKAWKAVRDADQQSFAA